MKVATLVCISDGEVDRDIENFDISTEEGLQKAITSWKVRIREHYDTDSEEEVLSRIEDGIINEYSYKMDGVSFELFFGKVD